MSESLHNIDLQDLRNEAANRLSVLALKYGIDPTESIEKIDMLSPEFLKKFMTDSVPSAETVDIGSDELISEDLSMASSYEGLEDSTSDLSEFASGAEDLNESINQSINQSSIELSFESSYESDQFQTDEKLNGTSEPIMSAQIQSDDLSNNLDLPLIDESIVRDANFDDLEINLETDSNSEPEISASDEASENDDTILKITLPSDGNSFDQT